MKKFPSYVAGRWQEGQGKATALIHAITGETIGHAGSEGISFEEALHYARNTGSPALRQLTFHDRARMLKALALHLTQKKELFYEWSKATGATRPDSWIDIEGGIGNLFVYSGKGRRDLPDGQVYVDGAPELISKKGSFLGHHICVPLEGTAIHINAFNFPCWGMLEKVAVNWLAGMPAIVKPATVTCYLTQVMVEEIIKSKILPEGALQLICGSAGDLLDHVDAQDVITFTGSAATGIKLKTKENIVREAVRFNMEADSLNFSILGPDAAPGTEEFDIFIKEVSREMTVKAGQKCTAIRRTLVPEKFVEPVQEALAKRLQGVVVGNPEVEGVRMGALVHRDQVEEVFGRIQDLKKVCQLVYGGEAPQEVSGADARKGAFMSPTLLLCDQPFKHKQPHEIEAFGPVSTLMPYKDTAEAVQLAKMGKGSLVGSVITASDEFARDITLGTAAYHGRLVFLNRRNIKESTGHGSPLPHLVHGGPGRAGGGEEMGGIRGIMHYMQRTAIQGHPSTLTRITNVFQPGADRPETEKHPFRKYFEELEVGETWTTHKRTVTEADIVNFANISGDNFYAHMDETSLEGSLFEKRVAHGYFVLSAAAGLFVEPRKGPVLANYGLEECRFLKPVYVGATIGVQLTVKQKVSQDKKPDDLHHKGIVKWQVEVKDETDEVVALATILTLVEKKNKAQS